MRPRAGLRRFLAVENVLQRRHREGGGERPVTPLRLVNLSLRLRGYGARVFGECSNQRAELSMRITHDLGVRFVSRVRVRMCACARA